MCRVRHLFQALTLVASCALSSLAGPNLVVNGGFESGLDNWIWTGDGVMNVATTSTDTPSGAGNSADLDINEVLGLPWLIQDVPVNVGEMLTFSAAVREERQFLPNFDAWIAAQVWMLPNSDSGTILAYNFTTFTSPTWETKTFDITVPAGATIARVLFTPQDPDFGVGTGRYRIDNVSLATAMNPSCPGNLNGDTTTDGADVAIIYNAWGTNNAAADIDDSGTVDGADLAAVFNCWGQADTIPQGVPEPAGCGLLCVGGGALLSLRRLR